MPCAPSSSCPPRPARTLGLCPASRSSRSSTACHLRAVAGRVCSCLPRNASYIRKKQHLPKTAFAQVHFSFYLNLKLCFVIGPCAPGLYPGLRNPPPNPLLSPPNDFDRLMLLLLLLLLLPPLPPMMPGGWRKVLPLPAFFLLAS